MKILHVISGVGKAQGGTAEIIPRLCEVQQRSGLEVMLASIELGEISDTAKSAVSAGVKLVQFKTPLIRFNRVLFSFDMMLRLGGLVRNADIVHIHGDWLFPVWWAARCARKFGKPFVMMPHGSIEPERLKISALKKKIAGALFDKRAYRDAAGVWVTAESESRAVREYGVTSPVSVVPLGLDVEKYAAAVPDKELLVRLGVDPGRKILLYFSRITEFKGLDILAVAWGGLASRFSDWQLAIVGPDDFHGYRRVAEAEFDAHCPTGSYVFTGPVYGDDKYKVLKSASLFVLPTRNENFSIAVQEALASGVPVVCTKGAPWPELEEFRCGSWVDVNADAIASGIERFMDMNDQERMGFGLSGLKLVTERYSWKAIAGKMLDAYKEVLP